MMKPMNKALFVSFFLFYFINLSRWFISVKVKNRIVNYWKVMDIMNYMIEMIKPMSKSSP